MISDSSTLLLQQVQQTHPEIYDLFKSIENDRNAINSKFSHNIKNIISIISSSIQFIESQHPETAEYSLWPQLKDAVTYLIHFLDQESLYRHSSNIDKKLMNLNDLLWCIPDLMDDLFLDDSNNGIRNYNFDISNDIPQISGDYSKLKFAFSEIVKNSFEATSNNDTIFISAHILNNSVIISFTDNGTGIDKNILNEVTSPFFTTKKSHAGTGLAIAEKVTISHGGNLRVTSNGNTCVTIMLPIDD